MSSPDPAEPADPTDVARLERHQRLSEAERRALGERLAAEYLQGRSVAALAEGIGSSAGRVRSLLLEQGVTLRPRGGSAGRPRPGCRDVAAALAEQYQAGASLRELAHRHGRSATSVRELVLSAGVQLRPRGGRRPRRTS